jgi:hypothetical protein
MVIKSSKIEMFLSKKRRELSKSTILSLPNASMKNVNKNVSFWREKARNTN